MDMAGQAELSPAPIVVSTNRTQLDEMLSSEWLLANGIGAYASSTPPGCNTRRYHGLLVAATAPPMGRIVALSTVMEEIVCGQITYSIATNEFPGAFSPKGVVHLAEFRNDVAATFVFRLGDATLTKRVVLAESSNAAAIQYALEGGDAELRLRPFAAMRDFHCLRHPHLAHTMTFESTEGGIIVRDRANAEHILYLASQEADFQGQSQWWKQFLYRAEIARGQDGLEDLYCPGVFTFRLEHGRSVQFNASLDSPVSPGFTGTTRSRGKRLVQLAGSLPDGCDETARRLAAASDAFIVRRDFTPAADSATILAGYHWFADWGRDAFISLPGLLLTTGRDDLARQVFTTFAGRLSEGVLPNCFDDRSSAAHYNSIDASLWFIIAAQRYMAATDDQLFWRDLLMPTARTILDAYQAGTMFDIRADADGLITGGSESTQLTWMDAKCADGPVTPRHGKAVEVNALWYSAHRIMADRCAQADSSLARYYRDQAELIGSAFNRAFWNAEGKYLFDCVTDGQADASVRPNQLLAVSLPHSPLSSARQAAVLRIVTDKLLTPYGLRTLSPEDPDYHPTYAGSPEDRDRAYHQGTVWAWLIGPYIEAYLKVHRDAADAVKTAGELLRPFDEHLNRAGIGFVSEIFDGDPPHTPRGCIAQAWSVGELLRAKALLAHRRSRINPS